MQQNDYEKILNEASEQMEKLLAENERLRQSNLSLCEKVEKLSNSDLELKKSEELRNSASQKYEENKKLALAVVNKEENLEKRETDLEKAQVELKTATEDFEAKKKNLNAVIRKRADKLAKENYEKKKLLFLGVIFSELAIICLLGAFLVMHW